VGEGGAGLGLHYVPGRGSVSGEGGRATASCFGRRRGGTGDGELLRPFDLFSSWTGLGRKTGPTWPTTRLLSQKLGNYSKLHIAENYKFHPSP